MDKQQVTIGITMRMQQSVYGEWRDALAHDWYRFMDWCFPDYVRWLPLPNLGRERVVQFARQHALSGIIFSGGNDLGVCPLRDETETALLAYARLNKIPVLGICRGLQLIWQHYGGQLYKVDKDRHVAARHVVRIRGGGFSQIAEQVVREVNSFHHYGLKPDPDNPLRAVAYSEDDEIEAVTDSKNAILALMWHPEREQPFSSIDQQLLHGLFLRNGK